MLWKHTTCFSVVFSGKSTREKTTDYGEMQTFNGYSLGEVTVEVHNDQEPRGNGSPLLQCPVHTFLPFLDSHWNPEMPSISLSRSFPASKAQWPLAIQTHPFFSFFKFLNF